MYDEKKMITKNLPFLPPERALGALASMPCLAFLDSADPRSRVSYLCLFPSATLELKADPYATLRRWMAAYTPSPKPQN
jgi:hypothetical protein